MKKYASVLAAVVDRQVVLVALLAQVNRTVDRVAVSWAAAAMCVCFLVELSICFSRRRLVEH